MSVFLRQAGGGFAQEAGSPISVSALRAERRGGRRLQQRRACGPRGVELRRGQRVGAAAPAGRRLRARGGRGDLARPRISAVAAGDFNSDGRLDLAATRSDGDQVVLLLRNARRRLRRGAAVRDRATPGRDRRRRLQRRRAGRPGDRQPGRRQRDDPAAGPVARSSPRRRSRSATMPSASSPPTSTATAAPISRSPTPSPAPSPPSCAGRPTTASTRRRRYRSAPRLSASTPPTSTATAGPTSPWPRTPAPSTSSAATPAAASRATSRSRSPPPSTTSRRPTSTATRGPTWPRRRHGNAPPDTFTVLLNPAPPRAGADAAGRRQDRQRQAGVRQGEDQAAGEQALRHADRGGPDPGRQLDRHAPRADRDHRRPGRRAGRRRRTSTTGCSSSPRPRAPSVTTLTLTERLSCPRKASASAAAKKKKKRRLWGDGSGKFRTKGKHSAATVVGTKWLVEDRCRSTLTRVVRGRV